jgi:hypothetical protein
MSLLLALTLALDPEASFRAYMSALNRHEIEPSTRGWDSVLEARAAFEVVSVRGDWVSARVAEDSLLNSALDVRRSRVARYRFGEGALRETRALEIRNEGRPFDEAFEEFEKPRREYNPAYSPDGTRIAFDAHREGQWESEDGGWEVWRMNADGTDRRPLTENDVNDWGPSWSPDGRTILFLSGRNNVYDVHAMDHDGSNVRRLTHWTDLGDPQH